jgi:chaperonin GroEL
MITTEAMIADAPDKDKGGSAGGHDGGMGGMGGGMGDMGF